MKRNFFISLILIVIVGLGYVSYQWYKIVGLSTTQVKRGDINSSVFASGKTKAEKEAHLSFGSTGKIVYLPVKKNQEVKKGQAVATIDTSDLKANLDKELQDYLKTRWDFEQTKATYKDSIITDTIARIKDKSQFDLNKSVTEVEISDRAIKNASLYTPFDGIVTAVNGQLNEWVSIYSSKPLVTIIDPQTVYFEAEIEEEDIGKISLGQETRANLDAYPQKEFVGKVSEIDKGTIVKSNNDTVLPVKIAFSKNDIQPITGLNGDVQIVLSTKKDILLVPKMAVKKRNGASFVVKKSGLVLKTIGIETGISDSKNIEIISGVSQNDQIVLPQEVE